MKAYWLSAPLPRQDMRLPALDLLRFLAALMVLLYHYTASGVGNTNFPERYNLIGSTELLPGWSSVTHFGFMGVNLFFLISGFIIFASASGRTALDFAVYRWIRLFPTYWVSILFTLAMLWFFLGENLDVSTFEVAANLTMVQSYLGVTNLDPVYWTLLVELHFYILIGLALLTRQLGAYRFWLSLWLVSAIGYRLVGQPFFLKYLIAPDYSAYFIAGMTLCVLRTQRRDPWAWMVLVASFLLACSYLPGQIAFYNFGTSTIVDWLAGSLLLALGFAALTAISLGYWNPVNRPWIVLLGSLTYPLYLVHHQLGRYLIDAWYGQIPGALILIFCTALSLLFALIVHWLGDRWIAGACRRLYKQHIKPKLTHRLKTKGPAHGSLPS
ncbi:acyltransferase family protein [Saccharospirillum impatiens]|uniref:acyltransferase family protein n=1 Tax=Saccharospirillum impatiens TaxID=169438 RepID=UPI000401323F|nr:acyltransferase [Saccharospirillum impatiens]